MPIAMIALLPLLGAILPPLSIGAGRFMCTLATATVSAAALLLLFAQAPDVLAGGALRASAEWLPAAGLAFSFHLDGLGLFFAGIILCIGLLIIVYAGFYLGRDDDMGRFFAYLLMFHGAMLGVVLSDNVLLLVVFWELTSLTSFLLIGFWSERPEGRQGARMALVVTGSGGLALLAGMILLGQAAGSYDISEILGRAEHVRASPLFGWILALVLIGAFTKSAQFPFHFWLPHAMAAPTPVSAYLHSATMVKAGVFLLARLWPVFAGTEAWFLVVTSVGLATMLVGAAIALFKDDLKAILAYSTVSHLGLITMLLGIGTGEAVVAAVFHILCHATFKAALFMSAGIVDHETHTRDIRRLGGLYRPMPITSGLALVAAASMAGIPPLNGFLSKEMMLEAAAHTVFAGNAYAVPVVATVAATLSVAYTFRFAFGTFLGRDRLPPAVHPHDPPVGLWAPVAVLVALVVAIGVMPQTIAGGLVRIVADAVTGPAPGPAVKLAIWHGLTPALAMSGIASLAGLVVYVGLHRRLDAWRLALPRPDAKALFDTTIARLVAAARLVNDALLTGSLQRYLAVTVTVILIVGAGGFIASDLAPGTRPLLPVNLPTLSAALVLAAVTLAVPFVHRDRFLALILTSVIGLVVSLAFLAFSAPDLALTQISVEVVATILLLLVLNLLPKQSPAETSRWRVGRDAVLAGAAGLGIGGLAYAVMTRDHPSISDFYLAQSKPLGGGTNVVNVILVDFRGFDTFGEIIVLGIAALVIVAMLETALRGPAARRLDAMRPGLESADRHPLLLAVATRLLLPLALTVGVFLLLRGHNQPGGGFIAGLVVAIAVLMQSMANGHAWTTTRFPLDAHDLIGGGVLIAALTGLAAFAFGAPFLTSTYGYLHIPLIGEVELASAMGFDLGVFLTVVGVALLSLSRIARIEARAEGRRPAERPAPPAAPAAGRAEPAPAEP
jgi:multicomponent K+:H+ antiporter subunit A